MKKKLTFVVLIMFILLPLSAFGSPPDKPNEDKVREFNFDEDVLTVEYMKPDLQFVGLMAQNKMGSLIQIRTDFVREIVESAEDL